MPTSKGRKPSGHKDRTTARTTSQKTAELEKQARLAARGGNDKEAQRLQRLADKEKGKG